MIEFINGKDFIISSDGYFKSGNIKIEDNTISTESGSLILSPSDGIVTINGNSVVTFGDVSDLIDSLNLGTMSIQDSNNVDITGGSISGIIELSVSGNVSISGDLTVDGATTTINSVTLTVDDKNIVLGDTESPTNMTANGGGIILKGTTNKTFVWYDSTGSWTSSENLNLNSNKSYQINGTTVLSTSSLGTSVVSSSLTSVGIISSGTWQATDIGIEHGGTGASTAENARTNLGLAIGVNVQAYDATIDALANISTNANQIIYATGTDAFSTTSLTSFGRSLIDDTNAQDARNTLGLGTISTQNADNVLVTNIVVSGNLTVNGTTTTINSTTLTVDDKNIVLGDTESPTNITADGGGIILKGTTNKTFVWNNALGSWTSSENLNLNSNKSYQINGTTVLSASSLGTNVVSSSLTSVGVISNGTWQATDVGIEHGGTGASTAANARTNLGLGTLSTQDASDVSVTKINISEDLIFLDGSIQNSAGLSDSDSYIICRSGDNLAGRYTTAKALTPGGNPLSPTNRATLIIMPGNYFLSNYIEIDADYVDVIGLGSTKLDRGCVCSVRISCAGNELVMYVGANDVRIKGLELNNMILILSSRTELNTNSTIPKPQQIFEDCISLYSSAATSFGSKYAAGTFINCAGGDYCFAGESGAGNADGIFINCISGNNSFGGNGGTASGTFINCKSGYYSFGSGQGGLASGFFKNCESGHSSFGGGQEMGGNASGSFINCTAGGNSFGGGGNGIASGYFLNCSSNGIGFGAYGTITGTLLRCNMSNGTFKNPTDSGKIRLCIDGNLDVINAG